MTPLVTIGIPCFNAAQWIHASIQSALDQTWPRCEVVVVDDGSTDTSLVQASAFGDRVTIIQSGRRGGNHARNMITGEARGEWIQFLDADDYLEPQKLTKQIEEAKNLEDCDVIYSPVWIETTKDGKTERSVSETSPALDIYSQWMSWHLPQTGGCLWRRSALIDIGGWRPEQPCCQEHELYLRAIRANLRWRYAPSPGAVYRIWSEDTLCRKDPTLVIRIRTGLIDALHSWLEKKRSWTPMHTQVAGRVCFEMARTYARYDLREAIRYERDRRRRAMLVLDGPAAPRTYRAIYRTLGFPAAEKIAVLLR